MNMWSNHRNLEKAMSFLCKKNIILRQITSAVNVKFLIQFSFYVDNTEESSIIIGMFHDSKNQTRAKTYVMFSSFKFLNILRLIIMMQL